MIQTIDTVYTRYVGTITLLFVSLSHRYKQDSKVQTEEKGRDYE